MSQRATPENFFASRLNVQTQEPIPVTTLQTTEPLTIQIDPNLALVLGLVAIVGLIGLFAYLVGDRKCH